MEIDVAALVSGGATALVSAMITDGWEVVRGRVAGIFRAQGADESRLVGALEAVRADTALQAGDAEAIATAEARVRARLAVLLEDYPQSAPDFSMALAEITPSANVSSGNVQLSGKAKGHGRVYQQGHGVQRNG